MEYLDPSYKRRHSRLLFTGYGLLALLIATLTALLVLESQGYYIDRGGEVVQNSLVILDSRPGGARVYVDGELDDSKTDTRLKLPDGSHYLEIDKSGYRRWQKEINLTGGKVEYLEYPLLIPERLADSSLDSYDSPPIVHQDVGRTKLALQDDPSDLSIQIHPMDDYDNFKVVNILPYSSVQGPVSILEWQDSTMLVYMGVDGSLSTDRYLLLDIEDQDKSYVLDIDSRKEVLDIQLGGNGQVYVLYDDNQLHLISPSESEDNVVATNVLSFEQDSSTLVLVKPSEEEDYVDVFLSRDLEPFYLDTFSLASSASFEALQVQYDGHEYLVLSSSSADRLKIYRDPYTALAGGTAPEVVNNPSLSGVSMLQVSRESRNIMAMHDDGFYVFDIEEALHYRFSIEGLDEGVEVSWLDNYHMMGVSEGELVIWEYDGNNRTVLGVLGASGAYFDKDLEFYIAPRTFGATTDIKRVELLVQ